MTLAGIETMYDALRRQAKYHLRREMNAQSISATVLVHEAWIALARSSILRVVDDDHYTRLFSRVMRNLLIDRARRKKSEINRASMQMLQLRDETSAVSDRTEDELLAVAEALEKLAARSPRLAEVVELRYFCGFTEDEVAQILRLSSRSVRRLWSVARLRLLETLSNGKADRNGVE
jgi:RNA polymerase sigma factor (TIGR02999 family)